MRGLWDNEQPLSPALLRSALALVGAPNRVIEAELHLLFDVTGKIIGCDPTRVDVEGGLALVRVPVNDLKLNRIPGVTGGRSDEPTLPGGRDAIE